MLPRTTPLHPVTPYEAVIKPYSTVFRDSERQSTTFGTLTHQAILYVWKITASFGLLQVPKPSCNKKAYKKPDACSFREVSSRRVPSGCNFARQLSRLRRTCHTSHHLHSCRSSPAMFKLHVVKPTLEEPRGKCVSVHTYVSGSRSLTRTVVPFFDVVCGQNRWFLASL